MKVKDLIAELQKLDPEKDVVVMSGKTEPTDYEVEYPPAFRTIEYVMKSEIKGEMIPIETMEVLGWWFDGDEPVQIIILSKKWKQYSQ